MRQDTLETTEAPNDPDSTEIAWFDLAGHLAKLGSADNRREHLLIGLQNFYVTAMMKGSKFLQPKLAEHLKPRAGQYKQMERELHSVSRKDKHTMVLTTMPFVGGFNGLGIDFAGEAMQYPRIDYPNYYLQPFHSIPGGWLNPLSMMGHRAALASLYRKAHKGGADGLREDVASLVPRDAKVVYDFGASTSDHADAMLARLGPDAVVHCVEPSPYGQILGRRLSTDPRIHWHLTMAEDGDFEANSADVVNIMFVLHECPDHAKQDILEAAYRVLKPGGKLIVTEPPPEDLIERSRGFFEPYMHQWLSWDVDRALGQAGFGNIESYEFMPASYSFHRVGHKPAAQT